MQKKLLFLTFLAIVLNSTAQSKAIYNITFNSIWNATDHTAVPAGAHWSKLVGASHKNENAFLEFGKMASTGIKNIAEFGNNTEFENEVNLSISNKEANQYINGSALSSSTGNVTITNLEMNTDFPFLTLVSMIAPSPDWIVVMNSINLLDNSSNWKNEIIIDVFIYDAGTDSGTNYNASNLKTSPFENITKITGSPFHGNKIGSLTIKRQSVLNVKEENHKNLDLYPNPTKGVVSINLTTAIQSIILYDVLGKQVGFSHQKTKNSYDFSHLKKGMYLVKIISKKNKISTKRLVIQ